MAKKRRKLKSRFTASTDDKFVLYQEAVQSAEAEVAFMQRVFRAAFGRPARVMREDFCGTALICGEWAAAHRDNLAIGVDLCADTQAWGQRHNIDTLPPEAAQRVSLVRADVRAITKPKVDVVCALNFSYFIFKEHKTLVDYFAAVRRSLRTEGVFVLDAYGGWESQQVMDETQRRRGFTYVWEQAHYNPVNDDVVNHITFRFPDGTTMRRAFTYDWRLWTLAAIRDALHEAGFRTVDVYWEGSLKNGRGNGVYRKSLVGDNSPGWNCYIAATH